MTGLGFENVTDGRVEFLDIGPPSWWPQLQEIAGRLGVNPSAEQRDGVMTFANGDEHYDGGALLLALLDRMDRCVKLPAESGSSL